MKKANEYSEQYWSKYRDARQMLSRCENPYDRRIAALDVGYFIAETKLIKVIKWPFLRTFFIAYYKEVESPFYKKKLPIEIFKLICKHVVKKYRF